MDKPLDYLHNHPSFADLIRIVAQDLSIAPTLIEKDYWIMHCLYGLQQIKIAFELKGGTSLSKGYNIIERFSEDIDIRIEPPVGMQVATGRNQDKKSHCESRRNFYDFLKDVIKIEGIYSVQRDSQFDDEKYRSGGLRLHYKSVTPILDKLKEGILLEVGFDNVSPNTPKDISSWAYDYASSKVSLKDNRATKVPCYNLGYTLVEKLQTISTKFRKQKTEGKLSENFMRHYYDVFCLLQIPEVQDFIGTPDYQIHKENRFRKEDNLFIQENEAFILSDEHTRNKFEKAYKNSRSLYYKGQPDFNSILSQIQIYIHKL